MFGLVGKPNMGPALVDLAVDDDALLLQVDTGSRLRLVDLDPGLFNKGGGHDEEDQQNEHTIDQRGHVDQCFFTGICVVSESSHGMVSRIKPPSTGEAVAAGTLSQVGRGSGGIPQTFDQARIGRKAPAGQ